MDHIAWGAAETGTKTGTSIVLSGQRADLGAAAGTRTFAEAAADLLSLFGDGSTVEITVQVNQDNFERWSGVAYALGANSLSLVGATQKALQGTVPNGLVTVYAQIVEGDAIGSAAAVQSNLDAHEADLANPHVVTAAQAGADPAGSASTVQSNLDAHTAAASPHSGHLIDVVAGANVSIDKTDTQRPIISASGGGGTGGHTIQDEGVPLTDRSNLNFTGNVVSATDNAGNDATDVAIQADPEGSAAAVQTNLDAHEADLANPHVVTAAQAGADPAGSASAVQTNLDAHTGAASPHSGHLIDVVAGSNISINKADAQRPVISSTGGGWADESLVKSWIDDVNALGSQGTNQTVPITDGQSVSIAISASVDINFTAVIAAGEQRNWSCRIATGGNTPTFQFNGLTFDTTMGWWDISANATYLVSFQADDGGAYIVGLVQLGATAS